jgi:hypothetical protein
VVSAHRELALWPRLLLACLLSFASWQGECAAGAEPARQAPPAASAWRFLGGRWQLLNATLSGEVDETTRAFAVAEETPFAYTQTLELLVTPEKHIGGSWSAGGLCLWLNSDHYWRLALVESPDGKSRYGELLQMREGQGAGEAGPHVLEQGNEPLNWRWGDRYRLRLVCARDRLTGEIYATQGPEAGKRLWHIVYALDDATVVHYGRLAAGLQGMRAHFETATPVGQAAQADSSSPITCAMLAEPNAPFSWLSLPRSRLVVNPNMSAGPNVPPAVAPSLPLNLAYYCGETPAALPGFWSWYPCSLETARHLLVSGPHAEFTAEAAPRWRAQRVEARFTEGQARLQVTEAPFGSLETIVTVDLDRTPYLLVRVPQADGGWALKVNPGDAPVDTYVQQDTRQTGSFSYDLRRITGWRGRRTFKVILFALGDRRNMTTVSDVRFAGTIGSLPALAAKETTWYPHQVVTQAEEGGLHVDCTACLADESTVAQRLRVSQGETGPLILTGQLPPGASARWDEAGRTLQIEGAGFCAALTLSRPAQWLGLFASGVDLLSGGQPLPSEGPARSQGGVWALALEGLHADDEVVVAARFAPQSVFPDGLSALVAPLALPGGFAGALAKQEANWEARLSQTPHPLAFTLPTLPAANATPNAIRRAYYRAWVFLFADVLPPQPENRYPYPQLACGKPALWTEGAPHARPTSQWESVLAMQYMALADPDTAWEAYEGLMSLADARGVLGGEGLPTRLAQTAWTLYSLTGDRQRLARIYPALKRLLLWKASDPRWLYKHSTPSDQKDSEFVVHALMDMLYAERIAGALEMPDEATYWQMQRDALDAEFHRWFWEGDGKRSFRIYRSSTGQREDAEGTWDLQALALPPALLHATERDHLLGQFRSHVQRDMPFLVPALAGFPKYNYTLQGLWQYGSPEEVELMAQSALRSVTQAGQFAENYTQTPPPAPTGVLPSVFGALQMIDGELWRSGLRMGEGEPEAAALPHALGLWNLRVRGKAASLVFDRRAGLIEWQGEGLKYLTFSPDSPFKERPLPDGTPRRQSEAPKAEPAH